MKGDFYTWHSVTSPSISRTDDNKITEIGLSSVLTWTDLELVMKGSMKWYPGDAVV